MAAADTSDKGAEPRHAWKFPFVTNPDGFGNPSDLKLADIPPAALEKVGDKASRR